MVSVILAFVLTIFLFACLFFFSKRTNSPSRASSEPRRRVRDTSENADLVLDVKGRLRIDLNPQKTGLQLSYREMTNSVELSLYLWLINDSSHLVRLQKITWDLWLNGKHLRSGTLSTQAQVAPKEVDDSILIRDILYDSGLKGASFLRSTEKPNCFLEGVLYAETEGSKIIKKFTLLNINLDADENLKKAELTTPSPSQFNRKELESYLELLLLSPEDQFPLSLILLDIDNLKNMQTTYGEIVAEDAAKMVHSKILKLKPETGKLFRSGDDEFALVLSKHSQDHTKFLAEKIREAIASENKTILYMEQTPIQVTVSGGAATLTEKAPYGWLIRNAYEMLKLSKVNGKNRIGVNSRRFTPEERKD